MYGAVIISRTNTGGEGFVGSNLATHLISEGATVTVVDNLSNGNREQIPEEASFVETELSAQKAAASVILEEFDIIFHLATCKNPNNDDPQGPFKENTAMTQRILCAAREIQVRRIAYTSSSTVYGKALRLTPEDDALLEPISVYGASNSSSARLLAPYAHSYGFTVFNFRFANVVGPRLREAVIPDFIEKLRMDSETVTILGDGCEEKTHLYVSDCLDAVCHVIGVANGSAPEQSIHTSNIGTRTTTLVDRIMEIGAEILGVDPAFEYVGGDRNWTADVPRMRLSVEKLSRVEELATEF